MRKYAGIQTCYYEARGEICVAAEKDSEFHATHLEQVMHKNECDSDEWEQRVIIVKLAKAHYDGRYP